MAQHTEQYTGIDISVHNGNVNVKRVRDAGYKRIIIRAGYGKNNVDQKFIKNAEACVNLNEPAGIYWFSYALNEEMAANEAAFAVARAKKYWQKCPVAYDLEYDTISYARKKGVSIGKAQATAFAAAFLKNVIAAGYIPVLYTNKDYAKNYFDIPAIEKALGQRIYIWYARYTKSISQEEKAACHIWQKSSEGKVDGISGNVDINEFYTDFETVISPDAEENKTVCNINILDFQKAANLDGYTDQDGEMLKEDGADGPKTQFVRKKVNLKAFYSQSGYKVFSKGALVEYWQRRLSEMGYETSIDGRYGKGTRKQTIAMQKDYGLSADGVAGYNTLSTSFYN